MGLPGSAAVALDDSSSRRTRIDRVPELDLLRFIAATSVVCYHLLTAPAIGGVPNEEILGASQAVTRFGYLGVHLFFMISGFVILWSSQSRTAVQFVIARFARLYPSYWVCMLLTALVTILIGTYDAPTAEQVWLNLTMVSPLFGEPYVDGVYWTLWVEMRFYVLVFIVLVTRTMPHVERWLGLWLATCVFVATGFAPRLLGSIAMAPLAPFFISGCFFYLMRARGPSLFRTLATVISCVLGVLTALNEQEAFMLLKAYPVDQTTSIVVACAVVAFHVVMAVMALRPSILPARSEWYILGSLTYPLYLVHNTLGKALRTGFDGQMPFAVSLVLCIAIVFAIAAAVAAIVERRLCAALQRRLQSAVDRLVARLRVVWLRPV